jgi:hypothetical protein
MTLSSKISNITTFMKTREWLAQDFVPEARIIQVRKSIIILSSFLRDPSSLFFRKIPAGLQMLTLLRVVTFGGLACSNCQMNTPLKRRKDEEIAAAASAATEIISTTSDTTIDTESSQLNPFWDLRFRSYLSKQRANDLIRWTKKWSLVLRETFGSVLFCSSVHLWHLRHWRSQMRSLLPPLASQRAPRFRRFFFFFFFGRAFNKQRTCLASEQLWSSVVCASRENFTAQQARRFGVPTRPDRALVPPREEEEEEAEEE